MSNESATLMPHNYDGIQEFDNRLPNWWLITLFGAIVFGAAYWVYFETTGAGMSAMEQFEKEQEIAQQQAAARAEEEARKNPITNALLAGLAADPAVLAEGKAVWDTNCVACHGPTGAGLVGPNLTDAYWINGHENVDIYKVIAEGVAAKGMPAWQPVLGLTKTKSVSAFVVSLRGKELKGKAPQGVDANGQAAEAQKAGAQ